MFFNFFIAKIPKNKISLKNLEPTNVVRCFFLNFVVDNFVRMSAVLEFILFLSIVVVFCFPLAD